MGGGASPRKRTRRETVGGHAQGLGDLSSLGPSPSLSPTLSPTLDPRGEPPAQADHPEHAVSVDIAPQGAAERAQEDNPLAPLAGHEEEAPAGHVHQGGALDAGKLPAAPSTGAAGEADASAGGRGMAAAQGNGRVAAAPAAAAGNAPGKPPPGALAERFSDGRIFRCKCACSLLAQSASHGIPVVGCFWQEFCEPVRAGVTRAHRPPHTCCCAVIP